MEAYNRFKKVIFEWGSLLFRIIGHDFLSEHFRRGPLAFLLYSLMATIMIFEIYTFLFYTSHTRIFAGLYFFVSSQLAVKVYHVRYLDDLNWLIQFAENLYKIHNKTESLERARYFHKFALFTEYFFICFIALYLSSIGIVLLYPLYMYFAENKLVPIMEVFIPGIDETTPSGFMIVTIYHLICFCTGTSGVCACDTFMAITIINPLMFAKIFSLEVQQLHFDLQEGAPPIALKYRLRNILLMHQGMNEYMKRVEGITFKIFLSQIPTNMCSSIVALYVVLTMKFLPAYALAFLLLLQIFIACLLGHLIELTNDRVYDVCLDLKWNELPHRQQLWYKFLIQRSQNPTHLTIGGVAPLNLDTFVRILRKIYSITMLIYTLVVE